MKSGVKSLGLLLALGFALGGLPAAAHRVQDRFKVSSHPVVTLHNSSGKVTIRSWQKSIVQVVANHKSRKVQISAQKKGNMVLVSTRILTDNVTPADLQANYQITVPQETNLSVHNDSGMVKVIGVLGDTTVETVAADVNLDQVTGYITVRTIGGSFTCKDCSGTIQANSISGGINLVGSESSNVQARTSTGNILLDSDLLPNGLYQLRNYSGHIDVLFSRSASFDVSAISLRGKVENYANLKTPAQSTHHLPAFAMGLFGTYNEGRARLVINSFSGTIVIRERP